MMMMAMPEVTGTRDFAHRRGRSRAGAAARARRPAPGASTMFSTTTTAASTSMPMAMARPPRHIRLADMPNSRISDERGERRERQDQRRPRARRAGCRGTASSRISTSTTASTSASRHRADGALDQVAAVVEHADRHARRAASAASSASLARTPATTSLGVGAAQAEHQAFDGLALAALRDGAVARERADAHVGDVADAHRNAVVARRHDDGAHVVQRARCCLRRARAALPRLRACARRRRCGCWPRAPAADRASVEPRARQRARVGHHLEGAHVAAERVDVGDARELRSCRADHPVEQRALLGQRAAALRS